MKLSSPKVRARSLSPIWIVPLASLVIALWLALHAWQQKGAEIEIIFDSAAGIEVGQTQIRLKDVPVGRVTRVRLSRDLTKVRVTATLDRQVSRHLSRNSRFWLVSPRISTSGVANLGTLISGVYIVMDPGRPGEPHQVFQGLAQPPTVPSDEQGTQYVLLADNLGSIDIGSPVYYRQLKVGEVTGYELAEQGANVQIRIFIESPHDRLVLQRSRFWNVSGLNVSVGMDGVKTQMASLASLINGGIAFENTISFDSSQRAAADYTFYLYPDQDSVLKQRYTLKYYYRLKFSHSVRGLSIGAPVEFRGIKVGEVVDVKLVSVDKNPDSLHVYVHIEPQRLDPEVQPSRAIFDAHLAQLVEQGLRAQLKTGSLLTGAKIVDLSFAEQAAPAELVSYEQYSELPTLDDASQSLDRQLGALATQLGRLPIEQLGQDLSRSVSHLSRILQTFEQRDTAATIDRTFANLGDASARMEGSLLEMQNALREVTTTLRSADALLSPDSPVQYELNEMLSSVRSAAQSLERLGETLNRKPNALIFGE